MSPRFRRILFYMTLAMLCYGVAFRAGEGVAFGVFLVAGIVGELFFWKEIAFLPSSD